jgi:membrane carboxypeptidase/penicillin-binding protein PbpC
MIKKSLVIKLCVGIASLGIVFFGWMYGYSGPIDQSRLTYSTYLTDEHGELLHVLLADDERYRIRTRPQDVDPPDKI